MPGYDRQSGRHPERVDPPPPDEQERVALLAAAQLDKGATPEQAAETLAMLGLGDVAAELVARRRFQAEDRRRRVS